MKTFLEAVSEKIDNLFTGLSTLDIGQVSKSKCDVKLRHPYYGCFSLARKWWLLKIRPDAITKGESVEIEFYGKDYSIHKKKFSIILSATKYSKRILYLPWKPIFVKAQIIKSKREIPIAHLSLIPSTENFAKSHMSKRLSYGLTKRIKAKDSSKKSRATKDRVDDSLLDTYYFYELSIGHEIDEALKYEKWIKHIEPSLFRKNIENSNDGKLISIILPTFNSNISHLRHAIGSVINQTYTNWELCIADDGSDSNEIRELIQQYCDKDTRIKAVFREENGHISQATNTALSLAKGEYVTFLDHDDLLSIHALNEFAHELKHQPHLDIIYSDEDFIDALGERCNPHFKSDWNPYLLYSHNYITHLCLYRHSLVKEVGGLRTGVEGAQDYDLILRCSALTNKHKIRHIPKILYHWRMAEGSTAGSASEKEYTVEAGKKALKDYFANNHQDVLVNDGNMPNYFKIEFPLPAIQPLVSLIIPTKDNVEILSNCIESIIQKTTYENYEILIVNNGSQEKKTYEYFESISNQKPITVINYDKPFNYSAINNFAVKQSKGDVIGLINNDIEVITGEWLSEMVSLALRQDTGCVGAKLYYEDETIQHAGVILGLGGYAAHSHRGMPRDTLGYFNRPNIRQNLSAVTGACMIIRRNVFNSISGLDENLQVAYNDVDFCLQVMNKGFFNVYTPYAELYHYESKTRGHDNSPEKVTRLNNEKKYLLDKWGTQLTRDQYYNPNLTRGKEDFSIKI